MPKYRYNNIWYRYKTYEKKIFKKHNETNGKVLKKKKTSGKVEQLEKWLIKGEIKSVQTRAFKRSFIIRGGCTNRRGLFTYYVVS